MALPDSVYRRVAGKDEVRMAIMGRYRLLAAIVLAVARRRADIRAAAAMSRSPSEIAGGAMPVAEG